MNNQKLEVSFDAFIGPKVFHLKGEIVGNGEIQITCGNVKLLDISIQKLLNIEQHPKNDTRRGANLYLINSNFLPEYDSSFEKKIYRLCMYINEFTYVNQEVKHTNIIKEETLKTAPVPVTVNFPTDKNAPKAEETVFVPQEAVDSSSNAQSAETNESPK